MATIHDIADYVISRLAPAGAPLNQLKLQKLLYYIQAWHLANTGNPIVPGRFQAWIHGPVSREVFDRFRASKLLYSPMLPSDVRPEFNSEVALSDAERGFINEVLEAYGHLSGSQLESMTHNEEPWIEARRGYSPDARCEVEISESTMQRFYSSRISSK